MSEKHTPAPWEIQERLDHEGGGPVYRIIGDSTLFLDVGECADGYVPGQNRANAYLIAAAPDLLAACQLWDEGFRDGEEFSSAQFLAWVNANRRVARAVIAKAQGVDQ